MIKVCWKCSNPFMIIYKHVATGHDIKACSMCNAPIDLDDKVGLKIMTAECKKTGSDYAKQWRKALKDSKKKKA
jgi:hypothetical protein